MVCLGNICRSPLAEGILKSKLPHDHFKVDSAGTAAYHIGNPPDKRSIAVAAQDDFDHFDKIFVMDHSNLDNIMQMALTPDDLNKVALLLGEDEVPDPYYGNENGFKKVFDLIDRACDQLSEELQKMQS
jgi:protein-tyrosine phosphatase